MDRDQLEQDFQQISAVLHLRLNEDPRGAISAARLILADHELLDETNRKILVSTILADAGAECSDHDAVNEALVLLEDLVVAYPDRPEISYNLANALLAKSDLTVIPKPDWWVVTGADRLRAKTLLQAVAENSNCTKETRARALTNLGNTLAKSFRLIEAYDCYSRALEQDSTNGVALAGAARALTDLVEFGLAVRVDVEPVIAHFIERAKVVEEQIQDLAGTKARVEINKFLNASAHKGEMPNLKDATDYQKFVASHRLTLAPTIGGVDLQLAHWDALRLGSITEDATQPGIPPIFAMFNVLKSEFLAARYTAYLALERKCPESGKYYDTLDFALYSTSIGLMNMAQKSCFDLLDKVAVAIGSYMSLPIKPNAISFTGLWFVQSAKNAPRVHTQEIAALINDGDFPLIALTEAAQDMNGFLKSKQIIRHATTHRFTILHDVGLNPSRESQYIEHYALEDFERQLIETLQMVRAVLFYFVHLVAVHERRKRNKAKLLGVIEVPDHDFIRRG